MGAGVLTDEKIAQLMTMAKKVTSAQRKPKIKARHEENGYELLGDDDKTTFTIYTRQNTILGDDFSCGIIWHAPSAEDFTLARYNGSSHVHRNQIEGDTIVKKCHIHRATERYAREGRTAEHFATPTAAYHDLKGALAAMAQDCKIDGLAEPQLDLDLRR